MRRLLVLALLVYCLAFPVKATDFTAPDAPLEVEQYMPEEPASFGRDLWFIIRSMLKEITPSMSEAMNICASAMALQMLIATLHSFSGIAKKTIDLVAVIGLSTLLLTPSKALINMGIETIQSICEYNKLLLPVITGALAAQGGTTTSAALYAGTVVLDTFLSIAISKVILPMLYAYIALGIAAIAINEPILKQLLDFLKWLMNWLLKITIYIFAGYMGITGVISGTVDAAALKAAKIAVSGGVPVIGKVVSESSDTILLSAGVVKNAVGVYGMLVIMAMWLIPFIRIGTQYVLLKITGGISSLYADKHSVSVVQHISSVMGYILAITSTVCLLMLISIVCFLKGMS
jgi:stage III sporulation protein AE